MSYHSDSESIDITPKGPSAVDLCCIFCCPPCPNNIVSKLAFIPPKRSYEFIKISEINANSALENSEESQDHQPDLTDHQPINTRRMTPKFRTKNKNKKLPEIDNFQVTHRDRKHQLNTGKYSQPSTKPNSNLQKDHSISSSINQVQPTDFEPINRPEAYFPSMTNTSMNTSLNSCHHLDSNPSTNNNNNLSSPASNISNNNDILNQSCSNIVFPKLEYRIQPYAKNVKIINNDFSDYQNQLIPFYVKKSRRHKLACLYIKYTSQAKKYQKAPSKYVILYSHGNAVDIGQMPPFYTSLAFNLKTDICCYDYSGYGLSTGSPSEKNIYSDIKTVYNYLINEMKFSPEHVIVYGQSIGTVASIDLNLKLSKKHEQLQQKMQGAENPAVDNITPVSTPRSNTENLEEFPNIARQKMHHQPLKNHLLPAALVLHSPLLSGWKVLSHTRSKILCVDPFPSYHKIKKVLTKTCVIHGTLDEVIHFSHGKILNQLVKNKYDPLWVKGAGHNDIEYYPVFLYKLKQLMEDIEEDNKILHRNQYRVVLKYSLET